MEKTIIFKNSKSTITMHTEFYYYPDKIIAEPDVAYTGFLVTGFVEGALLGTASCAALCIMQIAGIPFNIANSVVGVIAGASAVLLAGFVTENLTTELLKEMHDFNVFGIETSLSYIGEYLAESGFREF